MAKNPAAVSLGRLGGRAKSAKKAAAVRENGKLGGRPKKKAQAKAPKSEPRKGFWTRYSEKDKP